MTSITIYVSEGGALQGFLSCGHAGRMFKGYDLVCCAVSVLTQTAVNALESITGVEPLVELRDGYLRCVLRDGLTPQQAHDAQIVLQTVRQGLTDIQKSYPKFIRIQQEEWRQADDYDESSALRS